MTKHDSGSDGHPSWSKQREREPSHDRVQHELRLDWPEEMLL